MEKTQHTKGPWHWWDSPDRPKGYDLAKLLSPTGEQVLSMYGGPGKLAIGNTPENIANAEFIVRACNNYEALLAACKAAIEPTANACTCAQNYWPKGSCPACWTHALLGAAIANAEKGE